MFNSKLFRMGYYALSILAVTACGQAKKKHEAILDLGQFSSYVQSFEQVSAEHGRNVEVTDLIVKLADLPDPRERGVCEIATGQTPVIIIDINHWNNATESDREQLMFHELGHCVLTRYHNNGTLPGGIPSSVMNSFRIADVIYDTNHDHYMEELFN